MVEFLLKYQMFDHFLTHSLGHSVIHSLVYLERITVSASAQILMAGSQLKSPTCEEGAVLVREIGSCSAKNIIKVGFVYDL